MNKFTEVNYDLALAENEASAICALEIGKILDRMNYLGKLSIHLTLLYPNKVNFLENSSLAMDLDVNTEDSDVDSINSSLSQSREELGRIGEFDENTYYSLGDTFSFNIPVVNEISNDRSRVIYVVWAPDEGGRKVCDQLAKSADKIWRSFMEPITVN